MGSSWAHSCSHEYEPFGTLHEILFGANLKKTCYGILQISIRFAEHINASREKTPFDLDPGAFSELLILRTASHFSPTSVKAPRTSKLYLCC